MRRYGIKNPPEDGKIVFINTNTNNEHCCQSRTSFFKQEIGKKEVVPQFLSKSEYSTDFTQCVTNLFGITV